MRNFALELVTEPMDFTEQNISTFEFKELFKSVLKSYNLETSNIRLNINFRRIILIAKLQDDPEIKEKLKEAIPLFFKSMEIKDTMRWGSGDIAFVRPITNIMCLLDDEVIDFEIQGVKSDNLALIDYGKLREIDNASNYDDIMEDIIVIDSDKREVNLKNLLKKAAASNGKELKISDERLSKLTFISENPNVFTSEFNKELLALPDEILVRVLQQIDNIEPLYKDGKLSELFLVVNLFGKIDEKRTRERYSSALSSEISNIEGLFEDDKRIKLEDYVPRLNWLSENEDVGSLYDKTSRMKKLLEKMVLEMSLAKEMWETIEKATELMKADMATWTVKRYPKLRGNVGYELLKNEGEENSISLAIKEQYLPDDSGNMPSTTPGAILGVADRFDDILGYAVTGNKMYHSARIKKMADDSILLMDTFKMPLSINEMVDLCLYVYTEESISAFDYNSCFEDALDFFKRRIKFYLRKKNTRNILLDDQFITSDKSVSNLISQVLNLTQNLKDEDMEFLTLIRDVKKKFSRIEFTDEEKSGIENKLTEVIDFSISKNEKNKAIDLFYTLKEHKEVFEEILNYYDSNKASIKMKDIFQHLSEKWL